MKHCECINYINLDCEKGVCALSKCVVPIDGKGSEACPRFSAAKFCGNCSHFTITDAKHGLGECNGMGVKAMAYATCGAFSCQNYQKKD